MALQLQSSGMILAVDPKVTRDVVMHVTESLDRDCVADDFISQRIDNDSTQIQCNLLFAFVATLKAYSAGHYCLRNLLKCES